MPRVALVAGAGGAGRFIRGRDSGGAADATHEKASHGIEKNDQIEAIAAVISVLGQETDLLLHPRRDEERAAVSVLLTARSRVDHHRTARRKALNALGLQVDLGVDARRALTDAQVKEISEWRSREHDAFDQRIARDEATELARSIKARKTRLTKSRSSWLTLTRSWLRDCRTNSA